MTGLDREAARLQERFGRPGVILFEAGALGGVVAVLRAGDGVCVVALQGAQVLSWIPQPAEPDVLWLSPMSKLGTGKALRGGIPVCWPWFGPYTDATAGLPAHGFVRTAAWTVESTSATQDRTALTLGVALTEQQQTIAGHLSATLRVTLGTELELYLTTANAGTTPVTISEALHSYFAVGDIENAYVTGLDGRSYLDQLTGLEAVQNGPVTFDRETDRIYWDTSGSLAVGDKTVKRAIGIASAGSASTVVWNPWLEKSARLGDMPPGSHRHMLCVETANAGPRSAVVIAPGQTHTLSCRISSNKT